MAASAVRQWQRQRGSSRVPLLVNLDGCNLPIGCGGIDFRMLMTMKMTTTMAMMMMGGDDPGDGSRVGRDDGN